MKKLEHKKITTEKVFIGDLEVERLKDKTIFVTNGAHLHLYQSKNGDYLFLANLHGSIVGMVESSEYGFGMIADTTDLEDLKI